MVIIGCLSSYVLAADSLPPKRVLVLMPFQITRPGSVAVLQGIQDGVRANYPGGVDVVMDTVGAVHPEPPGFSAKVADWMSYKYGNQHFDVIVAVTSPTVAAAESLRDRLWHDSPLLLVLQEEDRPQFPQVVRLSSRVLVSLSNAETLRSALRMLPSTRHLAFLGGSSEIDRRGNAEILDNIRHAYPNLDIIEITGLSWDQTKARATSLPDETIILIGSFIFDTNSRELNVPQQVQELADVARAPIFADSDVAIGKGDVGGSVLSVRDAGIAIGEQLAQLLKGADPETLPVREVKNSFLVDWRQMKRWNISDSSLPSDAVVLYRPQSAWQQYNRYIMGFVAVLLLLLALVAVLLFERERRQKEEQLNFAMLESLPGLAMLVNRQGEILRTNHIESDAQAGDALAATDVPPGRSYRDYLRTLAAHQDDLLAAAPVEEVIAGSRTGATAELPLSSDRWIEIRAIRLPKHQQGSLIVHLDITERKRAELALTQSRAELYHLNRVAAMGQFAASLAHELSQPLAAIMSNAEAAQRFAKGSNPDMVEIREALDDIARDDKRARGVIQGMRAMLKRQSVVLETVDLNRIVASVAQMIRNEATLRGIAIELQLSPSPVLVKGDQVALQQVVLNLASNALDALTDRVEDPRLVLHTYANDAASSGSVCVEDNGPGVSAEARGKLFQPFFTTKKTGLGMGLSICHSILESLGGRIELHNVPREGATFIIELPLASPTSTDTIV